MTLGKCCTQYVSNFGKLSSGHRTGNGQLSLNSKERQCQIMLKLPHSCTYLTCKQSNTQNPPNEASTAHEPWTSRSSSWIRKGRGTRDQIVNIVWLIENAREYRKNIYFCFIDYGKACGCVDHNKVWKVLREMGIPDHLTCLLRNVHRSSSNS